MEHVNTTEVQVNTVNDVKMKKNKLWPVADQVMHAYEKEGKTIGEIANFFDCSDGTVRNLLVIRGATMRPRGRRKQTKKVGDN